MLIIAVVAAEESTGGGKRFWGSLKNILGRGFDVMSCVGGRLEAKKNKTARARLFLTDGKGLEFVSAENTVVIIRDAGCLTCRVEGEGVAVVDAGRENAVRLAAKTRLDAITCGLSPRDTITLSSLKEDSAVICLQRGVACFDGAVAEPQEIPVSLCPGADSFALMSAAAVYILSGNVNKLYGLKI